MEETARLKELKKLATALRLLTMPDNWEVIKFLRKAGQPLPFSEILNEIRKKFGERYNPNQLWRNLKKLEEADLIKSQRKIDISPKTGKARTCFYEISGYGNIFIEKYLSELFGMIEVLQNKT